MVYKEYADVAFTPPGQGHAPGSLEQSGGHQEARQGLYCGSIMIMPCANGWLSKSPDNSVFVAVYLSGSGRKEADGGEGDDGGKVGEENDRISARKHICPYMRHVGCGAGTSYPKQ